ncbi:hypothetical protein NDA16_004176 [Ustilago loliicola]|nr:hypothetical protein NDA16_004176 [Ustilago loliicola]
MPPKNSNNAAQNGNAGEEQKQTSQGHTLKEPPNTGWKGPIPAQNGGQEEGYLQKPPYCWESKEFQVKYHAKCWCGKRDDEGRNMVMAYPSSFVFENNHVPDVFAPTAHIFYSERVMDLDDDIPKWAGHKNSSEQLPHAPSEETDRTMGKGKRHKADRD